MKIIHFTTPNIQFCHETWDWAIQSLPYLAVGCCCKCHQGSNFMHFAPCCYPKHNVLSYTYNDLKNGTIIILRSNI